MKKQLLSFVVGGVMALGVTVSTQARAEDAEPEAWWGALAGSVAGVTDYVFRGVSQTQSGPALQGSLEYTHSLPLDLTVYGGTFASNVSFPDTVNNENLPINLEVDFDAGLRGSVVGINWDVGYIRISYPGRNMPQNNSLDFDWSEVYIKANYDFGFAKVLGGWYHSSHYSSGAGVGNYYSGEVDVPTGFYDITAVGHVGHLEIQNEANFGLPSYTDWAFGINRDCPEIFGVNVALMYYDTDVGKNDTLKGGGGATATPIDNRFYETATWRAVLQISKTF